MRIQPVTVMPERASAPHRMVRLACLMLALSGAPGCSQMCPPSGKTDTAIRSFARWWDETEASSSPSPSPSPIPTPTPVPTPIPTPVTPTPIPLPTVPPPGDADIANAADADSAMVFGPDAGVSIESLRAELNRQIGQARTLIGQLNQTGNSEMMRRATELQSRVGSAQRAGEGTDMEQVEQMERALRALQGERRSAAAALRTYLNSLDLK